MWIDDNVEPEFPVSIEEIWGEEDDCGFTDEEWAAINARYYIQELIETFSNWKITIKNYEKEKKYFPKSVQRKLEILRDLTNAITSVLDDIEPDRDYDKLEEYLVKELDKEKWERTF